MGIERDGMVDTGAMAGGLGVVEVMLGRLVPIGAAVAVADGRAG